MTNKKTERHAPYHAPQGSTSRTCLVDVILAGGLVLSNEVLCGIPGNEVGKFCDFFSKPIDGLLVHVGLSNELRQRDCATLGLKMR